MEANITSIIKEIIKTINIIKECPLSSARNLQGSPNLAPRSLVPDASDAASQGE